MRLGGRVAEIDGNQAWIADAFATIRVELAHDFELLVGDLVVLSGQFASGTLRGARVIERQIPDDRRASEDSERLLWRGVGRNLRARDLGFRTIRDYFRRERFLEVDTPIRVPSPGLDLHVDAISAGDGFLITSPEYHMKRLLSAGMPRIFQLVHATRADEAGALHQAEFMMLEWYRAFENSDAVMHDTEQIVARVVRAVSGTSCITLPGGRTLDVKPPFERITVRAAFAEYAAVTDACELAVHDEDAFFELFVSKVEPALARRDRPVFLCEYPASQASLARRLPRDPSVAERFELYVAGVELCNGFGELTDPVEQRARFVRDRAERQRRGRPLYDLDEKLLAALRTGLPRCAGNALGVDRLLMLACGATSIADVQAFPRDRV